MTAQVRDHGEPWNVELEFSPDNKTTEEFLVDRHGEIVDLTRVHASVPTEIVDDYPGDEPLIYRVAACVNACAPMDEPIGEVFLMQRALTWQPIDSAPRDDSFVLAWVPGRLRHPSRQAIVVLRRNKGTAGAWYYPDGTRCWHNPTYWMPLPPPPRDEA